MRIVDQTRHQPQKERCGHNPKSNHVQATTPFRRDCVSPPQRIDLLGELLALAWRDRFRFRRKEVPQIGRPRRLNTSIWRK
jgi:hypothetical protein